MQSNPLAGCMTVNMVILRIRKFGKLRVYGLVFSVRKLSKPRDLTDLSLPSTEVPLSLSRAQGS